MLCVRIPLCLKGDVLDELFQKGIMAWQSRKSTFQPNTISQQVLKELLRWSAPFCPFCSGFIAHRKIQTYLQKTCCIQSKAKPLGYSSATIFPCFQNLHQDLARGKNELALDPSTLIDIEFPFFCDMKDEHFLWCWRIRQQERTIKWEKSKFYVLQFERIKYTLSKSRQIRRLMHTFVCLFLFGLFM